jgi:protein phosphatase
VPTDAEPQVTVRIFGATDTGRVRPHNEDALLVAELDSAAVIPFHGETIERRIAGRGLLCIVADGMGGAVAGEVASHLAIDTVLAYVAAEWSSASDRSPLRFASVLRDATLAANLRIHQQAVHDRELRGMGTTATIAGVLDDTVYIAQIGDSRAYLVRNGQLQQITHDQSLTQRMVDAGELSAEAAAYSEQRNIILQALGPEPRVLVDLTRQQLRSDDLLLLCSDGLSGVLPHALLQRQCRDIRDPAALCASLIAEANNAGGPDNITVIVVQVSGAALTPPIATDQVAHTPYPLRGTLADPEPQWNEHAVTSERALDGTAPRPDRSRTAQGAQRVLLLLAAAMLAWAAWIVWK